MTTSEPKFCSLSLSLKGMDSGFAGGEDESYNVYDQPFHGNRDMASNIYRPSRNVDKDAYKDDFDTLMQNNRYWSSLEPFTEMHLFYINELIKSQLVFALEDCFTVTWGCKLSIN